jgi:hypothetical protein
MSRTLNNILPGVEYDRGFLIDGQVRPYYSFCSPRTSSWSDGMTASLEEITKDHFSDIYNRKIALDGGRLLA